MTKKRDDRDSNANTEVARKRLRQQIEASSALREAQHLVDERGLRDSAAQIAKHTDRRTFLKTMGVLTAGLGLGAVSGSGFAQTGGERRSRSAYLLLGAVIEWVRNGMGTLEHFGDLLGFDVVMFDAELSVTRQLEQLESVAATPGDWDVVFIHPGAIGALDAPVRRLVEAGVKVANIDTRLVPDPATLGVVTFTEPDNVFMGEAVTEALCEAIGYEGGIVMTQGMLTHTGALGRAHGFRNVIQKYPNIRVLDETPANWDLIEVDRIWRDLLVRFGDEIKAGFFHNDDMALAAQRTITGLGLEAGARGIYLGGVDAQATALRQLKEGNLYATALNSAARSHAYAMWAVYYSVVRGEPTVPDFIRADGPAITRKGWGEPPPIVGGLAAYPVDAVIESFIWQNERFLF